MVINFIILLFLLYSAIVEWCTPFYVFIDANLMNGVEGIQKSTPQI